MLAGILQNGGLSINVPRLWIKRSLRYLQWRETREIVGSEAVRAHSVIKGRSYGLLLRYYQSYVNFVPTSPMIHISVDCCSLLKIIYTIFNIIYGRCCNVIVNYNRQQLFARLR